MIPRDLLKFTMGRALGISVYGGPGMKKTLAIHTLPPPILMHEFEGGSTPLLPWTRRFRHWNSSVWETYSDADRKKAFDMVMKGMKEDHIVSRILPAPYIDVIYYDNVDPEAYQEYIKQILNFQPDHYNSIALDPLHEMSFGIQTFVKGVGSEMDPMTVNLWAGVQERTAIALRKLRNYRDSGVFIYLTSSEQIDKDYVKDPRETKRGELPQEPYSVKGTYNLPGKMPSVMQHLVDLQFHARPVTGVPSWTCRPEPLPGGTAHWEGKDRSGRLKDAYYTPNIRTVLKQIYGDEAQEKIYAAARANTQANSNAK